MAINEIYRIIDANINRASEALRVLEDWTRFRKFREQKTENRGQNLWNGKFKKIRHKINDTFSHVSNLILNRESVFDVGKNLESPSKKHTGRDVIRANCKRVEEALRVLAEYGQLLNVSVEKLEECRFEIYTIEKELIKNEKLIRLQNSFLYLVAGRDAPPGRLLDDNEFLSMIEKSIEGGVDIIQLREKNEKEAKILELAKEIKKIISKTEVLFIVNDRVDLALAADADGVHLGQDDMPISEARKITPEGFLIGLSTHNIEQGRGLINQTPTPDYLAVGPVFPTPTKPDYKPCGLEYVNWASKNLQNIPWFAIGGINESNIGKVIDIGAKKVAVVRAIMNSKNPEIASRNLKEMLTEREKLNV